MKRIVPGTLLLSMLVLAGTATAASTSATMTVSFVVKESCTVQLQKDGRNAAPTVVCGNNSLYQVSNQVQPHDQSTATSPASLQVDGQTWQVTF